jgi:cytoplasmic iron level regulating protein YaaA (DUF328/UPF0246 family)
MPNYTILLPPSEGKAPGGDDCRNWFDIADDRRLNAYCEMDLPRRAVINALLASLSQPTASLSKLFSVKGERLDEAIATNGKLPAGPLMPAIHRYSGVMYDFLDYDSMDSTGQAAFNEHVVIFSGLWGLLRPMDLIPDYKLKMDASLPGLGKVSAFWKPLVSALLNPMLDERVVWDLLPGAHRAAWDGKANYAARWQVKFVQPGERKGKPVYKTVTHWSKALKGALVRFICEQGVTSPDALVDFSHPEGYVYRPDESKLDERGGELLFVKE